jgi:hypothetical protein
LKFRDVLWPLNSDSARESEVAAAQDTAHDLATIQPVTTEPDPTCEGVLDPPAQPAGSGASRQTKLDEVRTLLKAIEAAFAETTGRRYQHADPRAVQDDRRAAARLLGLPGNDSSAIEAAWRLAITRAEWPRIETLADLARHWARFAPRAASAGGLEPPSPSSEVGPETCSLWAEIRAELREAISGETFMRWFAPLSATANGDELILKAPNHFHREFVNDNYRVLLEERARNFATKRGNSAASIRVFVEVAESTFGEARGRTSASGGDR